MQEKKSLRRTFGDIHRGRAGHINIQHYAQLIDGLMAPPIITNFIPGRF